MRREIGGIKRVGSVSSSEGAARMNAYRAGLSARDWGLAQRQRLGAPSGAPVAPGPPSTSPVDACDDRGLAQAVGALLGLLPVSNLHVSKLLMSGGTGTALVESECAWLGWQAAMMLGDEAPLPFLRLPVWVYEVEAPESVKTQRSQPEVRQLLERVNLVWGQAGIE